MGLRPKPGNYLIEEKLDGYRGILRWDEEILEFRSKRYYHLHQFQSLAERIHRIVPAQSVVFDGELIVLDETGHARLDKIIHQPSLAIYAAYDLLYLDGEDLRPLTLSARKRHLHQLLKRVPKQVGLPIRYHPAWKNFEEVKAQRLNLRRTEGFVLKCASDPYNPKTVWYKVKHQEYLYQSVGRIFDQKKKPR